MEPQKDTSQSKITDFFPTTHRSLQRGKRKNVDYSVLTSVSTVSPAKSRRINVNNICSRSQRLRDLAIALSPKKQQKEESNVVNTTVVQPTSQPSSQASDEDEKVNKGPSSIGVVELPATPSKPILSPIKFAEGQPILSPIKFKSPVKETSTPSRKVIRSLNGDFDQSTLPLDVARSSKDFRLPHHYQALADVFDSMDKVLCLLIRSKQQTTFERVKNGVERMVRKKFDHIKLAQIKTLYPESITFKYEKATVIDAKDHVSRIANTLVITPTRLSNPSDPKSSLIQIDDSSLMDNHRSKEFVKRLYDLAKEHHQKFLYSISPLFKVDPDKLVQWHKNFKLELLPPIPYNEDALPLKPIDLKKTGSKFNDLLEKFRAKKQEEIQLTAVASTSTSSDVKKTDETEPEVSANGKILSGPFKGLPIALYNKVKAREAQKLATEMTRPPQVQKKITMLGQFPELIRILKFYFVGEGKTTLPIEKVAKKLIDSYPSFMSQQDAIDRLNYMSEVLPDWLAIIRVKSGDFVKILDKKAGLVSLEERVKQFQISN